jgi:hypothetical protein
MHIQKINVRGLRAPCVEIGSAVAMLILSLAACEPVNLKTVEPRGLGNPCVAGSEVALQSPTAIIVGSDPVSCSSDVCLRPQLEKTTDTGPLCTQGCETDADCQDGQVRNPTDPNDRRCTSGFSCDVPIPNLASTSFACQKLCVCRDFLLSTGSKPASCP